MHLSPTSAADRVRRLERDGVIEGYSVRVDPDALGRTVQAVVDVKLGPGDVEDCEGGWANDGYAWSWAAVSGVLGVFDGEPREDFEDQWSGNQAFAWAWGAVTSAAALFDAGVQAREDFENGWDLATTI